MAFYIVPYWTDFVSVVSSTIFLSCIMAKPKISAPVGFFNAKCKPENQMQQTQQNQTPTIYKSLGFSLELIPSGKFVTVEFINKYGAVSRYNGRTGVRKYLKGTGYKSEETLKKYFVLWVRRGSKSFDGVATIDKTKIIRLSAGGVVLWTNPKSKYKKTV